jgi:hypothetical protein
MTTKDFDAMLAAKQRARPTFTVAGQEFTARKRLPFKRFQQVLDMMTADDVDTDRATEEFFRTILVPADRDRFIEALAYDGDDDDKVVDYEVLGEMTNWFLEIYTGKAPTSSENSSDGSPSTGRPRNVVSLNAPATAV